MKVYYFILIFVVVAFAEPLMFEIPGNALTQIPTAIMATGADSPTSNAIGDIEYNAANGDIWVSTGNGIAVSRDGGTTWESKLGGKGFSALAVLGDWIFAAESYDAEDPTDPNGSLPAGNGFYASYDNGASFTHIDSFVDQDVRRASRIGQLAYDIAIVPEGADTAIYAACFYGGILYSPDGGESWEELIVDGTDSLDFTKLRYRFFSIAADTSAEPPLVWAGSAEGLFVGRADDFAWVWHNEYGRWAPESVAVFDTTWIDIDSFDVDSISDFNTVWEQDTEAVGTISGEWIISIDFRYNSTGTGFFACTRTTGEDNGYDAISYTFDDGSLWQQTGDGYVAWNMGFTGDTLWTATTHGLSRIIPAAFDSAETLEIVDATDLLTGLPVSVMLDEVVSVTHCGNALYVGTYTEGLAIAPDSLEFPTWFILAHFPAPTDASEQAGFGQNQEFVYVFPNPYSPKKHGSCFFVFQPQNDFAGTEGGITIELFDYDIRKVCTIADYNTTMINDKDEAFGVGKKTRIQWDGILDDGQFPENGLYFFRITTPDGEFWGKLMIIK